MEVRVTDEAPAGQIDVRFVNLGPTPSTIGEIFFDTGTTSFLDSIAAINPITAGVSFVDAGAGGTLPGGNGNPLNFSTDLGAARTSQGGITNGIDPGEELQIIFNLAPGMTLADLAANIGGPLDLTKLRVGIHVQSISGGGITGSDSRGMIAGTFTPRSTPPVPEPSTYLLGGLALSFVGLLRRSKQNS